MEYCGQPFRSAVFPSRSFTSIQEALLKYYIEPRHLTFEVTEPVVMKDVASSLKILNKLSAIRMYISIADSCAGHSKLMYLKQFPARRLKIDNAFLNNISGKNKDFYIISKIAKLGQLLGMKIVAEGVDTAEQ